MKGFFTRKIARTVLLSAVLIYIGVIGAYVTYDHRAFRTQAFDLGIFDQALWLVSQGKTPFITVRGLHRFGDHTEFILYALAPIYWVWDHVCASLWFQTVIIALGSVPVFLLARNHMGYPAAVVFGIAYLLNPSVQNLNLDHVHAEAFASTALIFSFYFATVKRFKTMFFTSIAAMLCKEDVAIATAMIGLFTAWRLDRKAGLTLATISGIWFVLCLKVFLPAFNETGFFRFHHGGWFAGFYANMSSPSWYIKTIFRPEIGVYLIHLLAPLAFLPLISPSVLVLAVPAGLINILSGTGYLLSIDYHYMTSITPFLMAAAIAGASRISTSSLIFLSTFPDSRRKGRFALPGSSHQGQPHSAGLLIILGMVLGAAILGNMRLSHIPLHKAGKKIMEVVKRSEENDSLQSIREAIRLIPADAPVSADYVVVPHLTHREKIYMFPNPFENESWGIRGEKSHDPNQIQFILVQDQMLNNDKRLILSSLTDSGRFKETFFRSGVHLFERSSLFHQSPVERPKNGYGLVGRFFRFQSHLLLLPDVNFRSAHFQTCFKKIHFPVVRDEFVSIDGIHTGMERRFLAIFDGYIRIERTGEYEFIVRSDDGFRLLIGGTTIGEFNGLRAFEDTRMRITLKGGLVPIQLYYFENEPPHGLHLLWRPPGHDKEQEIEPHIFFPSRESAELEMIHTTTNPLQTDETIGDKYR